MNLQMEKRYRIILGDLEKVAILLVGCGGTGSFLALHLARLAYHAARNGLQVDLTFIDPDRVEEKNIGRQNFCPAEIGEYKAFTLARRFSLAFGLDIKAINKEFTDRSIVPGWPSTIQIVAGCVDTPAARSGIPRYMARYNSSVGSPVWWLDGGNHQDAGQVHLGNSDRVTINPLGFCSALPHPGIQAPDLLEVAPQVAEPSAEYSCAELMALNAQSLMINQSIAGWMATYTSRLLIGKDLDIMATYINLAAGSVRSVGITKSEMLKVLAESDEEE